MTKANKVHAFIHKGIPEWWSETWTNNGSETGREEDTQERVPEDQETHEGDESQTMPPANSGNRSPSEQLSQTLDEFSQCTRGIRASREVSQERANEV